MWWGRGCGTEHAGGDTRRACCEKPQPPSPTLSCAPHAGPLMPPPARALSSSGVPLRLLTAKGLVTGAHGVTGRVRRVKITGNNQSFRRRCFT